MLKQLRCCREARLHRRYLIIVNLLNQRSAYQTAAVVGVANTTVYRVAERFREHGEAGLLDAREDNGEAKLDERYLSSLNQTVRSSPRQHGWRRPTWTREMLVETLAQRTGVRIHTATMSRALTLIYARRGRHPVPWFVVRGQKTPENAGWQASDA